MLKSQTGPLAPDSVVELTKVGAKVINQISSGPIELKSFAGVETRINAPVRKVGISHINTAVWCTFEVEYPTAAARFYDLAIRNELEMLRMEKAAADTFNSPMDLFKLGRLKELERWEAAQPPRDHLTKKARRPKRGAKHDNVSALRKGTAGTTRPPD